MPLFQNPFSSSLPGKGRRRATAPVAMMIASATTSFSSAGQGQPGQPGRQASAPAAERVRQHTNKQAKRRTAFGGMCAACRLFKQQHRGTAGDSGSSSPPKAPPPVKMWKGREERSTLVTVSEKICG